MNDEREEPDTFSAADGVGADAVGELYFKEGDLVEVDVGDEPILDDEGDDYDDYVMNDENFEGDAMEEPDLNIVDMSYASFSLHNDSVYCTAFHPLEPGLMVSGGGDDRAFLWRYDVEANEAAPTLPDHPEGLSVNMEDAATSPPSGRHVLWCKELDGHTDTVTSVGFNFDGTMVLTGGFDGVVNVWSVPSGDLILRLEGPEDVEWASWHSKGNAVLAGSKDGTIWMWLAPSGQCVQVFAGHDGGVSCGVFTQDGKNVCSGGEDGTVRVWGPKTGACKHVFGQSSGGHQAAVTCLANSRDGELLLSGGMDGELHLFHVSGKRLLQTFVHSLPEKVSGETAESAEEQTGDAAETAMEEGSGDDEDEEEGEEQLEAVKAVECVGIAAKDLKWLASGGADFTLKIWDLNTGTCRCVCRHEDSVVSLQWHESLPVVVTACLDFNVRVWDARSGGCLSVFTGHRDLVTCLEFTRVTSTGERAIPSEAVASVSDDGTVKVFHFDAQQLILA